MAKYTLKPKAKEDIERIVQNYEKIEVVDINDWECAEATIDTMVVNALRKLYVDDNLIKQQSTSKYEAYSYIKSKKFSSNHKGYADVSIFNYFKNENIDMIIEDKKPTAKPSENPIQEAILYCEDVNISNKFVCRVSVGVHPGASDATILTRVLSDTGNWEEIKINGNVINGIVGPEILTLIYKYPGITEFIIPEIQEDIYTKEEFRKLFSVNNFSEVFYKLDSVLPTDEDKINFTISLISLKIILEKYEDDTTLLIGSNNSKIYWDQLRDVTKLKEAINTITSSRKQSNRDIVEKYGNIFKDSESGYDFEEVVEKIRLYEEEFGRTTNSSLMKAYDLVNQMKNRQQYEYDFDLFGEIFEALAEDGTKEKLGKYFTKRHIIKPLVQIFLGGEYITHPGSENGFDSIIQGKLLVDPFCGTGGFLTEVFKAVRKRCKENGLSNEEISYIANENIYGYDIYVPSISRTKINMMLAGDGNSNIKVKDTLENQDDYNKFNYIITNVPYITRGQEKAVNEDEVMKKEIHKVPLKDDAGKVVKDNNGKKIEKTVVNYVATDLFIRNNKKTAAEYNSLIKIVQMLKKPTATEVGGRACVIIPDGILENSQNRELREWLICNCKIESIISLPEYAFAPYTLEKTYAIIFQKRQYKLNDVTKASDEKMFFYIIDKDGFATSSKLYETNRRDENGNLIDNELSRYVDYQGKSRYSMIEEIFAERENHCDHPDRIYTDLYGEKIAGFKYGHVSMEDILENRYEAFTRIDWKKDILKSLLLMENFTDKDLIDYMHHTYGNVIDDKQANIIIKYLMDVKKVFNVNGTKKNDRNAKLYISVNEDIFDELMDLMNVYYEATKVGASFYDRTRPFWVYRLNLLPEKYLRPVNRNTVSLEEIKNFHSKLLTEMQSTISRLQKGK